MAKPTNPAVSDQPDETSTGETKTFFPTISFTGYPDGKKTEFFAGKESVPVPVSYLELLRTKGLVAKKAPAESSGKA